MNRLIPISLSLVLALSSARAETEKAKNPSPATPPAANSASANVTVGEPAHIELKTKSAFALQENARSPFWPIGWKPAPKAADPNGNQAGADVPQSAFVVTSITMQNNAKFAIVNGKIMQEGQQFGLQLGNQTYQVVLKRIEDGQVVIGRRDEEIVVPLRRK